jgi:hypothetical protein
MLNKGNQQGSSRVYLTLTLVFLAGVGTGMLAMHYGLHEQLHAAASSPATPNTKHESADALVEQYRQALALSPDQTKQIAVVIKDYNQYFESVQAQIEDLRLREQIDDLRSTGKNRILEILNPDQRIKFEKMSAELAH